MHFLALLLPAVLSAGSALAANITVIVGNNATLTFTPSSVTAQTGDMINFQL
jgi:plastocyanin